MQELSTSKPNFPLKYTKDFNQTTHVPPHGPIIFTGSISLYSKYLNSVQDVLKESQMVMSELFQHSLKFFAVECILKCQYALFSTWWFFNMLDCTTLKMAEGGAV